MGIIEWFKKRRSSYFKKQNYRVASLPWHENKSVNALSENLTSLSETNFIAIPINTRSSVKH